MIKAIIVLLTIVPVLFAGIINLEYEGAVSTPIGGWNNNLSNGLAGGLYGSWLFSEKFSAGLGVEGVVFGDANEGTASFTQFKPMGVSSFYFRPHGTIFNPGVVIAFGYCQSRLSSEDGIDPASWDLFWRAGFRWNFSIGSYWRAGVGMDLESVLASQKTGDSFKFAFGISRRVEL